MRPSRGFLLVLAFLFAIVGVVGVLSSAGCEDYGSECQSWLPPVGVAALVIAVVIGLVALTRGAPE